MPRIALLADQWHNPSGVGVYTRALVRNLQLVDPETEYVVVRPRCGNSQGCSSSTTMPSAATLPDRRLLYPLWHFFGRPRLETLVGRFDLVHVLSGSVRVPTAHPCVITIHDLASEHATCGYPVRRRRFKQRLLADVRQSPSYSLIAVSGATKSDLLLTGISEDRVTVTHEGVDADHFRPVLDKSELAAVRRRYELPEHYLLFLGVLSPRKNVVRLLRAYDLLHKMVPSPPHLVIAGPPIGWREREVYKTWQTLSCQDHVRFIGYVTDPDLPAVYSAALALVYPSLYEGFGLPILEAMACGLPVVCSRATSLPEVAGDAALYVSGTDERELAQALSTIATSDELRSELRSAGFRRAAAFSWKECAEATVALYSRILGTIPTGSSHPIVEN